MDHALSPPARADSPLAAKRDFRLPPAIAERLLDLLCSDDAYRELFRESPREALVLVGLAEAADPARGPADGPWACLHGQCLPSKPVLRGIRDALHAQMTSRSPMAHMVFIAGPVPAVDVPGRR